MAFLLQRTFSLHLHGYDMRRILGAMACFVAISAFAQSEPGVQQNCQAAPDGVLDQTSKYGGSTRLALTAFPMVGDRASSFPVSGAVRGFTTLKIGTQEFSVEWSGFRLYDVKSIAHTRAHPITQGQLFNNQFGSKSDKPSDALAKSIDTKDVRNVGPSVQYILRDKTGQAREFHNYTQPITIDGDEVFLAGVRVAPNASFSYLRIPADAAHTVKDWVRLRAALYDGKLRQLAAGRYARSALPPEVPLTDAAALAHQLEESTVKAMAIFAGNGRQGGYVAVSQFLEGMQVNEKEKEKAAKIFIKILNGSLFELWHIAREQEGLQAPPLDQFHERFLELAINALSDNILYGGAAYLQLDEIVGVTNPACVSSALPVEKMLPKMWK